MSVATGSVQATMQLSAVIVEKIKHKHSQKESNFPLPSLTSALPPCSRPLEFIQPLATRAEAWQAIPGVSEWVMGIIKRGYSLQFARRPLRFSGVVSTSVQGENVHVLHSEVMTLLEKGAIEMVPPALSESGFYSRYFLVPKKDGGLRPILDLRCLNHALMRRPFRMITLKQILSQIRTDDMSVVSYINHQGLPERVLNTISEARAPSKPCRTTSALAGRSNASAGQAASALLSMAVLQVYQAKLLSAVDESEPDATDLALRATKTTAQAIGGSMASLVVLERHLWLTLTEIKGLLP